MHVGLHCRWKNAVKIQLCLVDRLVKKKKADGSKQTSSLFFFFFFGNEDITIFSILVSLRGFLLHPWKFHDSHFLSTHSAQHIWTCAQQKQPTKIWLLECLQQQTFQTAIRFLPAERLTWWFRLETLYSILSLLTKYFTGVTHFSSRKTDMWV